MSDAETTAQEVLDFWFGAPGTPEHGTRREIWFRGRTPEFDQEIRDRFMDAHERAAAGALDELMETARGCLALFVLLDQFPRNMFRGSPRAFATDPKALAVAKHAFDRGFHEEVSEIECSFFRLPLMHSEEIADQDRLLAIAEALGDEEFMKHVVEHRDLIVAFGRFPHRNAILGRESTPEEEDHLAGDANSFGQGDDAFKEAEKAEKN